jgi:RNA polymerase sigma factor (sigma-70 family)
LTTLGGERLDGDRMDHHAATAAADVATLAASLAEPDRFAGLFDRYHADIRRYAASRLGGELADDIAADAFLVAFRSRHRFVPGGPGGGNVRAWLYGIATNLIRRHHRDEERRYRAMSRAGTGGPASGGEDAVTARVAAGAARIALARALSGLPAGERDALLLVAVGQLDYAEVASALGIPVGTVGSRLTRARKTIRAALGGADPTRIDEGI